MRHCNFFQIPDTGFFNFSQQLEKSVKADARLRAQRAMRARLRALSAVKPIIFRNLCQF